MGRGIYGELADSETRKSKNEDYLEKGAGQVLIKECFKGETKLKEEYFRLRVRTTATKERKGKMHAVGENLVWIVKFKTGFQRVNALKDVKSLVLAVVGFKESEVTAEQFIEQFEDAVNYRSGDKSEVTGREIKEVQDLRGMLVNFDTEEKQTKAQKEASDKGGAFETRSYVRWAHCAEQGDIAKRRAELDVTDPLQG